MNEYAITLKISWWSLFFTRHEVETFIVNAYSAVEAVSIAQSGMLPGLLKYEESFEEEDEAAKENFSHLKLLVLAVARV